MSKNLGNVIDPIGLINKYGADTLRYYILAKFSPFIVGNFGDLANGLGNLVSRVAKLAENSGFNFSYDALMYDNSSKELANRLENYRFDEALKLIWNKVTETDKYINENEPWKLSGDKLREVLSSAVYSLLTIGYQLAPFLPETAEKIEEQFKDPKIRSSEPLFPRLK